METYRARLRRRPAEPRDDGADQQIPNGDRSQRLDPRGASLHQNLARALADHGRLKYCETGADPSRAVRNVEPKRRQAVWEFAEVRQLCKQARRSGYYGLAAAIAVAWDTSMSPVDVRNLKPSDRHGDAFCIKRAKTGRMVI